MNNAALKHGYKSLSEYQDAFLKTFGRLPKQSRSDDYIVTTWIESPLGLLLAGARTEGICLLEFTNQQKLEAQYTAAQQRFTCAVIPGKHDYLNELKDELERYFAGALHAFTVPLVYFGTPFQKKVWDQLRTVPYGETTSYEALAEAVGAARAQRAVGNANGKNRIAILIPCHRVISKSGGIGGYGSGLWRKEFLLNLENGSNGTTKRKGKIK
jgi:AraC family transcriptional regulator, regulatory protein of adaptative response / methylated-DNA-[protein]-cysteine methyltransferase